MHRHPSKKENWPPALPANGNAEEERKQKNLARDRETSRLQVTSQSSYFFTNDSLTLLGKAV